MFAVQIWDVCFFITLYYVQVRKQSEDSQKALANSENSHQRAKDLDTETQNLLRRIQGKTQTRFVVTDVFCRGFLLRKKALLKHYYVCVRNY